MEAARSFVYVLRTNRRRLHPLNRISSVHLLGFELLATKREWRLLTLKKTKYYVSSGTQDSVRCKQAAVQQMEKSKYRMLRRFSLLNLALNVSASKCWKHDQGDLRVSVSSGFQWIRRHRRGCRKRLNEPTNGQWTLYQKVKANNVRVVWPLCELQKPRNITNKEHAKVEHSEKCWNLLHNALSNSSPVHARHHVTLVPYVTGKRKSTIKL